ncbi:MAG TPA: hypothetical protein VFZ33_04365 [Chitinophagaceae bacterium]
MGSCKIIFYTTIGTRMAYINKIIDIKIKYKNLFVPASSNVGGALTDAGIRVGYYDLHPEIYDHKPTKKELYELIKRWGVGILSGGLEHRRSRFRFRI